MKLLLKITLGILGFFALFGMVGTLIILLKDPNKMPPRPDKRTDVLLAELNIQGNFSLAIMRNPHKAYTTQFDRSETDPNLRNNHRIYTRHFPNDSINDHTTYKMGGIEEQFAIMAVLMLHDRGILNIQNPVRDYLPELPDSFQQVKLQHLLSHTSGLAADVVDYRSGPTGAAGEVATWSAANYRLLEALVAWVTEKEYAQFILDEVVAPLELEHTRFVPSEEPGQFGSWYTCTDDLLRWDLMLNSNRLVLFKTLKQAFAPITLNDGTLVEQGFGWTTRLHRSLLVEQNLAPDHGIHLTRINEKNFILVILTEKADLDLHQLALQISEIYLDREMNPRPDLKALDR